MLKMLRIFGLIVVSAAFLAAGQADTQPWKDNPGRGAKQKHGNFKKNKEREYERERGRGRQGGRRGGGPPPWAPAHGYRGTSPHDWRGGTRTAYVAPYDLNRGHCDRGALGTVLGAATGGAVGSTVGRGDGRTAAIIGGTVLGALVGGSIGRSMDRVDQNCVGQTLEHAPDGSAITWNADDSRARHQVTPVKTYQDTRGRYCREYQTTSVVGGRQRRSYGTACRQPDGSWQLMN